MKKILVILILPLIGGCMTYSSGNLSDISPSNFKSKANIEVSVGRNFYAHLDGGKMMTSNMHGRIINDHVFDYWEDNNYISSFEYVPLEKFSGKADYNITLHGVQDGQSNIGLQVLCGLTLFIIPSFVDMKYSLEYALEDVKTGKKYKAKIDDSLTTMWWLPYILVCPFSLNGRNNTMDRIAEYIHADFVKQGAFNSVIN